MTRGQPAEVEIGKDIAEQNELAEIHTFEQVACIVSPAYFRAKMEIGQYQRVAGRHHDALMLPHGHDRGMSVR